MLVKLTPGLEGSELISGLVNATECARDRGHYEEKNTCRQSEVCVLGNMISHRETQIHASKWAWSLNFWRIFKKVVWTKQKKRIEKFVVQFICL